MSEQDLYAAMLASMKEFQAQLCQTMREWQAENRSAFTRIHERLDAQMEKEVVSSGDCETRRVACKSCMNTKIDKASGYPAWVTWTVAGCFSMITALVTVIVSK